MAEALDVELAGDGEEGLAAEEVAAEVHLARGIPRQTARIEGGDPEELTRPFAVARGDERRVDPHEALFGEMIVHRPRDHVTHPRDRADGVGARTQVGDLPQVLEGMALGRHRVGLGIVDPAHHFHRVRLELAALSPSRRFHRAPGHRDRAPRREVEDFRLVVRERRVSHHLEGGHAGTVVHLDEGEALPGIAPGAHPAPDPHRTVAGGGAVEDLSDSCIVHHCFSRVSGARTPGRLRSESPSRSGSALRMTEL